jgi:hypothetical protein
MLSPNGMAFQNALGEGDLDLGKLNHLLNRYRIANEAIR